MVTKRVTLKSSLIRLLLAMNSKTRITFVAPHFSDSAKLICLIRSARRFLGVRFIVIDDRPRMFKCILVICVIFFANLKIIFNKNNLAPGESRIRGLRAVPDEINQVWSMDFIHDQLEGGRAYRLLNVIGDYNREAIGIEADFSLPSERVIRELKKMIAWRGKPQIIRCDNVYCNP
jgi:hypothetical protein